MMILVITHDKPDTKWNEYGTLLKEEAKEIWSLQKNGSIRSIWFRKDTREAIIMFEGSSIKTIMKILKQLPLVKENLITFEIMPLETYDGYERLFC